MKIKITHLTSAHPRYDTRIFVKECCSLAKIENYEVSLIVADGLGDELKSSVHIYDVGKLYGRLNRILKTTKNVLQKAIDLDSDIYHFHDPELIPIGLKLKQLGKKVIFDSHEDVPKQILAKHYLPEFILKIISKCFELYENYASKKFDAIITATPIIKTKFLNINKNSIDINNFPIIEELSNEVSWDDKKNEICYIGGLAKIRGIEEIVQAMEFTKNIKLNIAGKFIEKDVEDRVKNNSGWEKVNYLGFLNRKEVSVVLADSKAGLVTLHPTMNYMESLPVKMFEYMIAGIPVIYSDFPLWKDILQSSNCGIPVNPLDSKEIAKAIEYLIDNPDQAKMMGDNGKKAVLEKYNWSIEEQKLLFLYSSLI